MLAALTTLDTIAAVLVAVFALRGAFKGFAWQALRTVGLFGAIWAAFAWRTPVATWLTERVSFLPSAAAPWTASIAIFVGVFLLATWLAFVTRGALRTVRLGGLDLALGLVLGAAMGFALFTLGFVAWGKTVAGDGEVASTLQGSWAGKGMGRLDAWLGPHLPEELATSLAPVLDAVRDAARR